MGDHMIFAMSGIPAVAVTASGIFDLLDSVIHSHDDDMKNINFEILNGIVRFLEDILR